jgi:hypothetical protein
VVSHSCQVEFGYSLNITDIQTWTETQALVGKGQTALQQALDEIAGMLPFALLCVDQDNGSEFISWHLQAWCTQKPMPATLSATLLNHSPTESTLQSRNQFHL